MQNTAIIHLPDNSTITFVVDTKINKCVEVKALGNVFQQLKGEAGEAHALFTKLVGDGLNTTNSQKAIFKFLESKKGIHPKW